MAALNPGKFIGEVRREVSRISWPGRKQVMITTLSVCIMTVLFAIFFFLVDLLVRLGLQFVI